jgi:hypothetical protein
MKLLRDWSFIRSGRYTAIVGRVVGDEGKFPDGTRMTTSRIRRMDFKNMTVETRNSTYQLVEPNGQRIINHNFADSQQYGR